MEEFETLLELLPGAAILADSQTRRILFANTKAGELTAFPRTELSDFDLSNLFRNWEEGTTGRQVQAGQHTKELIKRNGSTVEVSITSVHLPPKGKWFMVLLEPANLRQLQHAEGQRMNQVWTDLYHLSTAPHQEDFKSAIDSALAAGVSLLKTDILALYQADEQKPELLRSMGVGEIDRLPDQLPPQDLVHLQEPYLWVLGKRSSSNLHRAARAARLSYLASAPLGQANASIGLIVAADEHGPPPGHILPLLQVLSAILTIIIQQYAQAIKLQENLKEQKLAGLIHRTIQEAVQEGLLELSPDLKALNLNPAAEMMFGYASREVRDQPVEKILIGTETIIPALTAAQQGSPTYGLGNVRLFRRSGEAFLAHIRTIPVINEGVVERIMIFIRDLSEQEQIREHTQQLEQRALLGEVTAIFAHEVRNPINNISTGLQLMAINLPEKDPNQESIARLQQDCDRLAELMKSVLAFSRPTDYEMENCDLGQVIQRLLERLRPRMTRVNVKYNLQIEPNCPQILGNPRALEQVFTNLINNAIQAMSETGGSLVLKVQNLKAAEGRGYLEVSIADTGPGIPKEIQEHIFQPFFTTNHNGTGLGLAITKRIVTAHKGNIRVTSFPGGTVFHVQLPVANQ